MNGTPAPPGARILIVDDNPSIHRDFDLVLSQSENQTSELDAEEQRVFGGADKRGLLKPAYQIDHALSGLEGIEKVQAACQHEHPYQLAFVDIRMPGIDGVETVSRLWEVDARVQIVICTAYADYSWEDLEQRLGPTDNLLVLKKPFDAIEVVQMASALTEKWRLARQAGLKLEQMELLVAQRTQKLLELLRRQETEVSAIDAASNPSSATLNPAVPSSLSPASTLPLTSSPTSADSPSAVPEPPLVLFAGPVPAIPGTKESGQAFRALRARDLQEAFEQAKETVPDLVVIAITQKDAHALDLCRRLKQDELVNHIAVLALTEPGADALPLRALEAGADDCVPGSLTAELVSSRLARLKRGPASCAERSGAIRNLHPRELATTQPDAEFLRRLMDTIEKHLADYEFNVDSLAQKMGVSRRQLFRKLKAITDCTPNGFIRTFRLNRAAQLLESSSMTVTEITYAVGFSDLKHFRAVFREQFGVLPGEYPSRVGASEPVASADAPS